jgi:hypothetical protein
MTERSRMKATPIVIIILAVLCLFLIWFLWRSKTLTGHPAEQSAVQKQKENVVTLSVDAQKEGGISTTPVKAITHTEEIRAYGMVLQLQTLTDLRNSYVRAKTQVEKALTDLDLSKKEYERLKVLNEDNKNVSDKAVQAAQATMQNNEETVRALREALNVLEDTAHQQWGDIIAQWLSEGSPALRRLLQQKDMLIQLTLPAGARIIRTPKSISVVLAGGSAVPASFVSLSPRTDPNMQGISFFYAAPSANGKLLAGMNVTAQMPSSGTESGFFVPTSAVVWLQDKASVYVKKSETGFSRVEVPVSNLLDEGYFVSDVFSIGDQIVVRGAQALLSEESKPKTTGGKEADED